MVARAHLPAPCYEWGMSAQFAEISDGHRDFIGAQHVFFVGTAARDGRVNVSPKGLDSLRVLGPNRVLWLSVTGSTNEAAAHVLVDPRMTLMFCSFERKPLVLRLFGKARVVHDGDADWLELLGHFPPVPGERNIFDMHVDLVQTSCGFGVPLMDFVGERDTLVQWAERKGADGLRRYRQEKNRVSIDGLPTGLPRMGSPEPPDAE